MCTIRIIQEHLGTENAKAQEMLLLVRLNLRIMANIENGRANAPAL